jgi:hypothetical protein
VQAFRSQDLQKQLRVVLDSAGAEPAVLLNRGQPRVILMSAEEFRRLKLAAGEAVPAAALPRRPLVLQGRPHDPLGYDTSDNRQTARRMADDALSGRTAAAVDVERERIVARLGLADGECVPAVQG